MTITHAMITEGKLSVGTTAHCIIVIRSKPPLVDCAGSVVLLARTVGKIMHIDEEYEKGVSRLSLYFEWPAVIKSINRLTYKEHNKSTGQRPGA